VNQTVVRSDERIDEGVSRQSWDSTMQLCAHFSKDKVHHQLSKEDHRWECAPLDFSCVSVQCDFHTYWCTTDIHSAPVCDNFSSNTGYVLPGFFVETIDLLVLCRKTNMAPWSTTSPYRTDCTFLEECAYRVHIKIICHTQNWTWEMRDVYVHIL
jgi:hypothetical protein